MNKAVPTPKSMLNNIKLSCSDMIIYIYFSLVLHFHYKTRENFKLNISKISKETNISKPTVRKSIQNLIDLELLNLNTNTLYYFNKNGNLENWEDFNHEAFKYGDIIKDTWGGYVETPYKILFNQELSASEKLIWLKIKSVKLNEVHFNAICKLTNTKIDNFKKVLKKLKEKGYIFYEIKRTGSKTTDTKVVNLKLIEEPAKIETFEETFNEIVDDDEEFKIEIINSNAEVDNNDDDGEIKVEIVNNDKTFKEMIFDDDEEIKVEIVGNDKTFKEMIIDNDNKTVDNDVIEKIINDDEFNSFCSFFEQKELDKDKDNEKKKFSLEWENAMQKILKEKEENNNKLIVNF